MQIYCPKCNTAYQIDDGMVGNAEKVRCANCHEIFSPRDYQIIPVSRDKADATEQESGIVPEDAVSEAGCPAVSETDSPTVENEGEAESENSVDTRPDDIKEMFARLSAQTEQVFAAEAAVPVYKKVWYRIRDFLGLRQRRNYKYYILLLIVMCLLVLYNCRYEIVRHASFMEPVYALAGIKARIPGEGLEFRNVTRREFEKDDINHMEVKGFIANNTDKEIIIPLIHLELLNRDAEFIEEKDITPPLAAVKPHDSVAFNIILAKPSSLTKYIYLTFIEKEN